MSKVEQATGNHATHLHLCARIASFSLLSVLREGSAGRPRADAPGSHAHPTLVGGINEAVQSWPKRSFESNRPLLPVEADGNVP
jgi:hypothetical protein